MLNIAAIMGRLTAEPELKHTPNDVAVCSFTLAVDRSYVKQGEERKADFINVVTWRSAAEFVCKYFTKGQMMAVTGSIQTRNYEDKQGNKRTAFEIVASDISFCGSKRDNAARSEDPTPRAEAPTEHKALPPHEEPGYEQLPMDSIQNADDLRSLLDDGDLPF